MPLRPYIPCLRRLLLAGATLALVSLVGATAPVIASEFTDAAGRRINLPDTIRRVLPAERSAEGLVYVLAPDRLVGLEPLPSNSAKTVGKRLPTLNFRL